MLSFVSVSGILQTVGKEVQQKSQNGPICWVIPTLLGVFALLVILILIYYCVWTCECFEDCWWRRKKGNLFSERPPKEQVQVRSNQSSDGGKKQDETSYVNRAYNS